MTVLFTALLLLAAIVTALSGSLVFSFHESDAAGQGMAKAFALLASIFLWVVLGGLVLICIKRGGLPGRTVFVALVLLVAAAAGHFAALDILGGLPVRDRFEIPLQFVAVASPCLINLYCVWSYFPFVRALIPVGAANITAAVLLLVVSMIPWFLKQPVAAAKEARMQAYRAERARDLKILDRIETLPDDTAIAAFLAYVDMPPGRAADFRGAAIARMKAIPGRQQEVEDLLSQLDPRMLSALRDLDLKMTSSLCEAARKCAQSVAGRLKPSDPAPAFDSVETTFNNYSQSLAWMADKGCDCRQEIAGLEQAARLYPDSFPRKWFTDYLLDLQGKSREP